MRSTSPSRTSIGVAGGTTAPFRHVPLRLCRSSKISVSPRRVRRACWRETRSSSIASHDSAEGALLRRPCPAPWPVPQQRGRRGRDDSSPSDVDRAQLNQTGSRWRCLGLAPSAVASLVSKDCTVK